jgi:hypothetical protein
VRFPDDEVDRTAPVLSALALLALVGAFVMLFCVRRESRPSEQDGFLQLAQSRQFVLTPPPAPRRRAGETGSAVASLPSPEPARPEPLPLDDQLPDVEQLRVEEWRRSQLLAAGLAAGAADAAVRAGVDAGSFRSLVARGCPPGLALKILL